MNSNKLWDWILNRQKSISKETKPLHLIKESFDHHTWKEAAHKWKNSNQHSQLISKIKCSFFYFKTGISDPQEPIQFLEKDNSKGFVIVLSKLKEIYSVQNLRSLQYLLSQQLVEYGYTVKLSDIRSTRIANQLQKTYRYYHKPRFKLQLSRPINQLLGNVTSELILKDNSPYILRVMAHKYSDRNYADAPGLEEMMDVLLH